MKFFQRFFRRRSFRWSLQIIKDRKRVVYSLNENSVIRLLGYVMRRFANGKGPIAPWSLQLVFNQTRQSIELTPDWFSSDGERFDPRLIQHIEIIDPDYMVKGAEPVFIEVVSNKRLELSNSHLNTDKSDIEAMIRNAKRKRDPNFFDVLDDVFGSSAI